MYWRLLTLKLMNFERLHQRNHISMFISLSLTTKSEKLFDLQKCLIIMTLLKHYLINQKTKESISIMTYKIGITMRNNTLNYKDVVNSSYIDAEVSFILYKLTYENVKNQNFESSITNIS